MAKFSVEFERTVDAMLHPDDRIPRLHLDCELTLSEIDNHLWKSQGHFEPFGMANPRPTYWLRRVFPAREPMVMKEKHLRLVLRDSEMERSAVFFGGAADPLPSPPWDVAFHLETNTYRGETSIELQVTHLRESI